MSFPNQLSEELSILLQHLYRKTVDQFLRIKKARSKISQYIWIKSFKIQTSVQGHDTRRSRNNTENVQGKHLNLNKKGQSISSSETFPHLLKARSVLQQVQIKTGGSSEIGEEEEAAQSKQHVDQLLVDGAAGSSQHQKGTSECSGAIHGEK